MKGSQTFKKITRPLLFYSSLGCYLICFDNFYWESKVKQSYERWHQQQHQYYQQLHEIDPTFPLQPGIEAPPTGFFTSTEKIYKLGMDFLKNEELYQQQNTTFFQQVENKLTTDAQQNPANQLTNAQSSDETSVEDVNHGLVPSNAVLLEELKQQHEKEESSRNQFLETIKSPPFFLVDSQTNEYRYQSINLLKIGVICQFLPMAGKFGPLLSAALITSFFVDLNPRIEVSTDQK